MRKMGLLVASPEGLNDDSPDSSFMRGGIHMLAMKWQQIFPIMLVATVLLVVAPAYAVVAQPTGVSTGPGSAQVDICIPNCGGENPSVTLTTGSSNPDTRITCQPPDSNGNVVCNLPATTTGGFPFRFPAGGPPTSGPQFEITRTTALSGRGAEFQALGGSSTTLAQLKLQNTRIKKVNGSSSSVDKVQIKISWTFKFDTADSLNNTGRVHGGSSKGTFFPSGRTVALQDTHTVAEFFTYVVDNVFCTPLDDDAYSTPYCTETVPIPCSGPAAACQSSTTPPFPGTYTVAINQPQYNVITPPGGIQLTDSTPWKCYDFFEDACQPVERDTIQLTYGLKLNDRIDVGGSGATYSGEDINVITALQAAEDVKIDLHESNGVINPDDNGHFKVSVYGSALLDTSSLECPTEGPFGPPNFGFGLPGGTLIPAVKCMLHQNLNGDGFPDAFIMFSARDLATAGITCDLAPEAPIMVELMVTGGINTLGGTIMVPLSGDTSAGIGPCKKKH